MRLDVSGAHILEKRRGLPVFCSLAGGYGDRIYILWGERLENVRPVSMIHISVSDRTG